MTIISFNTQTPGLQGVNPRTVQLVTTDNLATITAAGYMNKQGQVLEGMNLIPTDIINCIYSYVPATNSGTFIFMTPTISNGIITLVEFVNPGDVLLPVVSGDFAIFNGTTGQIYDAGYSPSNAAKTVVIMANGAVTTNHIAQFADTAGTLKDGGVLGTAAAKAASDNTKATLASVTAATTSGHLAQFNDTAGTIGDSGVTTASISGAITQLGQLYQVSATFNTAQMVTAYDTPLQIVANPLSSQMILPHFASVYTASTGHTAYATGTAPIIQYSSGGTNGAHGAGTIATAAGLVAGDITAAASQVRNLYGLATGALTGLSGLGIYFSNATGDYTAGAGTNVTITLVYELLTATV